MSTNMYYAEQIIYYSGLTGPNSGHHWGWHISTTSDDRTITVAASKTILLQLEMAVRGVLKVKRIRSGFDDWDLDMAAMLAITQAKGTSEDSDWLHCALSHAGLQAQVHEQVWDDLCDLIAAIDLYPLMQSKKDFSKTLKAIRAIPRIMLEKKP